MILHKNNKKELELWEIVCTFVSYIKIFMKTVQNSFIRSLCAIIIGVLLIRYREETVTWLTILIGVLFFLSGLISCITYFIDKKHQDETVVLDANGRQISGFRPTFPIVGLGSMVLGAILALMPTVFMTGLVYILAAILILGAINQFVILATINRILRVGVIFWLLPCVVLAIGVIAIAAPRWIASAPLFVLGWTLVLYGVIECIDAFKVMSVNRKYKQNPTFEETAIETTEIEPSVTEPKEVVDMTNEETNSTPKE